jgi:hypothetical protein
MIGGLWFKINTNKTDLKKGRGGKYFRFTLNRERDNVVGTNATTR